MGRVHGTYNSAGHDKRPEGGHGVRSHSLQHAHPVLRVLCLHCVRLVVGDFRLLVKVVGMLLLGDGRLALDLGGVAIGFSIFNVTHVGRCLPV